MFEAPILWLGSGVYSMALYMLRAHEKKNGTYLGGPQSFI
jgi:hypothetical protein